MKGFLISQLWRNHSDNVIKKILNETVKISYYIYEY